MECRHKWMKTCLLILLMDYFATKGSANHLKDQGRPQGPFRNQRQGSPRPPGSRRQSRPPRPPDRLGPPGLSPPGPTRKSGPPRPPVPLRELGPPRASGPTRQTGPSRQSGLQRGPASQPGEQPGLKRGPPRQSGPARQSGLQRGPAKQSGPARQPGLQRGPARQRGPRRKPGPRRKLGPQPGPLRQPGLGRPRYPFVSQGRSRPNIQLLKNTLSIRQRSSPMEDEFSKVGVSGMGKFPEMPESLTSVQINVQRRGPSIIQNKVQMERLSIPRDLDKSQGSIITQKKFRKWNQVGRRSQVRPMKKASAKDQVQVRRQTTAKGPRKQRFPVTRNIAGFTPLGHIEGYGPLSLVSQINYVTPLGQMGKGTIPTPVRQRRVGQGGRGSVAAVVGGRGLGMSTLIQAIARMVIIQRLRANVEPMYQPNTMGSTMGQPTPMPPVMAMMMFEGGMPELF